MKRLLLLVVTVIVGVVVVAGSALAAKGDSHEPAVLVATVVGKAQTPEGELTHATLDLSIFPGATDAQPAPQTGIFSGEATLGGPFYNPSTSLQVPAHSLVTVTVKQYDTGGEIYNPFLATVSGTVDGTANYDGKVLKGIDPKNVAHTFTIHQFPENTQPYLFVSVPFPAHPDDEPNLANGFPPPYTITFSFITGGPGTYVWNCQFPCGSGYMQFGGPMSTRGWMAGTLAVV